MVGRKCTEKKENSRGAGLRAPRVAPRQADRRGDRQGPRATGVMVMAWEGCGCSLAGPAGRLGFLLASLDLHPWRRCGSARKR